MIRPGPDIRNPVNRLPEQVQEQSAPVQAPKLITDQETLNQSIEKLVKGRQRLSKMPVSQRVKLLSQCIPAIRSVAREWVELACEAKGIAPGSPARSEELLTGPVATVRQLQMFLRTMRDIAETGSPYLPKLHQREDGRVGVPVTPFPGLHDPVVFISFKAITWMQPGIETDDVAEIAAPEYGRLEQAGISVVLGAGNISAIPAADVLSKLCIENRCVLLKMNPVNEYLGSIFERAFHPLIENDLLRVVYGGPDVAQAAIHDDRIDDIHVTGSSATHDAIVWGSDALDQLTRKHNSDPVFKKPITSELGNVTPWVVVPGQYSPGQLKAQAENIVSSMITNAAFNCITTRVVLTWKQWPERERFLQLIEATLARIPQRRAYYPGAMDRYEQFSGMSVDEARGLLRQGLTGPGSMSGSQVRADGTTIFVAGPNEDEFTLPWTFIRNVNPVERHPLLEGESFVSVCAEVPIDADNPQDFLAKAVPFCNERLWGTLAASMSVPFEFRRSAEQKSFFQSQIDQMLYGAVSINQWNAIQFALMSPPWGGYPGATLDNPLSGIGWVHNAYMLTEVETTVLDAPLTVLPKPVWSPSHHRPEQVAWALFDLMCRPSLGNVAKLSFHALKGAMAGSS